MNVGFVCAGNKIKEPEWVTVEGGENLKLIPPHIFFGQSSYLDKFDNHI